MNVSEIIEALRATPETGADPDVIFAAADALESAQKDAARYRELKDHWIEYKPAGYDGRNVGRFDLVWDYPENDLDHAIDTAMAAQEQSK